MTTKTTTTRRGRSARAFGSQSFHSNATTDSQQPAATRAPAERGYSAEEVKAMADGRGLPCEVHNSNGVTTVQPLSTLETLGLVRVWSRFMTVAEVAEDTFDRIARAK